MKIQKVMLKAMNGEINWVEAAEIIAAASLRVMPSASL